MMPFGGGGAGSSATGSKIPSGYREGRLQQFTPEAMDLYKQLFAHLGPESYLSKLAAGDESFYGEMEAPALRQFSGLQGNIASRFSGMGMGGRKSSGFQNTMSSAASYFAQELQANRQNLRRQAIQDLMGLSGELLQQKPYENFLVKKQPKKKSFWEQALGIISPLGGDIQQGNLENTQNFLSGLSGFMGGGG